MQTIQLNNGIEMTIIFDLDGTLLNTIDDLGHACNHALEACGFPTHPIEEYPRLVGNGVNKLIEHRRDRTPCAGVLCALLRCP